MSEEVEIQDNTTDKKDNNIVMSNINTVEKEVVEDVSQETQVTNNDTNDNTTDTTKQDSTQQEKIETGDKASNQEQIKEKGQNTVQEQNTIDNIEETIEYINDIHDEIADNFDVLTVDDIENAIEEANKIEKKFYETFSKEEIKNNPKLQRIERKLNNLKKFLAKKLENRKQQGNPDNNKAQEKQRQTTLDHVKQSYKKIAEHFNKEGAEMKKHNQKTAKHGWEAVWEAGLVFGSNPQKWILGHLMKTPKYFLTAYRMAKKLWKATKAFGKKVLSIFTLTRQGAKTRSQLLATAAVGLALSGHPVLAGLAVAMLVTHTIWAHRHSQADLDAVLHDWGQKINTGKNKAKEAMVKMSNKTGMFAKKASIKVLKVGLDITLFPFKLMRWGLKTTGKIARKLFETMIDITKALLYGTGEVYGLPPYAIATANSNLDYATNMLAMSWGNKMNNKNNVKNKLHNMYIDKRQTLKDARELAYGLNRSYTHTAKHTKGTKR